VTVYYFCVLDRDFGPGFIKLCSYFPYPAKVWVNGHEWAKRQAATEGLACTELANGFAACDDPARLQAICDRLGPADLQAFFDRWMARIPTPLTLADQAAGYWWELSMRQIEVSRTLVFDQPRRARAFFEALVADNLDLGRPDEVRLIFDRRIQRNTPGTFATRIVTRGVEVAVNVFYQHSRIKQYLKEGRALRVETVVNSPTDLGCQRRLRNLDQLQAKARATAGGTPGGADHRPHPGRRHPGRGRRPRPGRADLYAGRPPGRDDRSDLARACDRVTTCGPGASAARRRAGTPACSSRAGGVGATPLGAAAIRWWRCRPSAGRRSPRAVPTAGRG